MTGENSPWRFDERAIGLYRILLAVTILADQLVRLGDWHAFHSHEGLVSLADSRAWDNAWGWSLYWLSEGPWLPPALEALRLLATLALLTGVRSRLSAFVLFVLLASAAARNPLLLQGGDKVLVVMTFFGAFLPLGRYASLERLWFGTPAPAVYRSAASAAFAIQVLLVFFMSGILKTGEQWWGTGTAISMAIHLEVFATETVRLWRHWDGVAQALTYFVFWLECLAPCLALVPLYWFRLAGLGALVSLEVGIWLSLEVGLFPLISLVSLVPLAPPRLVDFVWRRLPAPSRESDLVLFYDRECRFCAFACRLLMAVCGLRAAELREAQADARAAAILEESFAWSAAQRLTGGDGERFGPYRQGWDAVLLVVEGSPRAWLARLLPKAARGARVYGWIARNRGAIGRLGAAAFGRGSWNPVAERARRAAAGAALGVVVAWNAVSYPAGRECRDLRPYVAPLAVGLGLGQYWNMFGPYPNTVDYWHAMPGLTRDDETLDVLSGRAVSLAAPADGPDRYGGYRWRKTIRRSLRRGEMDRVFRYFCLTGEWQAMDLWEFHRPNPGNARPSVQGPYRATRVGRWQCDLLLSRPVADFRAAVDARMATYSGGAERWAE